MTADELRTLRALTGRLLPGPPEDRDPGALEAGAAEAIELLLGAFDCEQPPIHAAADGGFVPLDSVAELGWRIRLEGSRGMPEREFAGPVTGLAQLMSEGLALLDHRSREANGLDFADATATEQDALLEIPDERLTGFVRLVLMMTLDVVYGSPQYGGNRDGAGWKPLGWPGFTQPAGFTAAEVSEPDAAATTSGEALTDLRSGLESETGWQLGSE
jgi:Gluconate 2-dehydrogenase subunit 3